MRLQGTKDMLNARRRAVSLRPLSRSRIRAEEASGRKTLSIGAPAATGGIVATQPGQPNPDASPGPDREADNSQIREPAEKAKHAQPRTVDQKVLQVLQHRPLLTYPRATSRPGLPIRPRPHAKPNMLGVAILSCGSAGHCADRDRRQPRLHAGLLSSSFRGGRVSTTARAPAMSLSAVPALSC
jgi:hypothetical protein